MRPFDKSIFKTQRKAKPTPLHGHVMPTASCTSALPKERPDLNGLEHGGTPAGDACTFLVLILSSVRKQGEPTVDTIRTRKPSPVRCPSRSIIDCGRTGNLVRKLRRTAGRLPFQNCILKTNDSGPSHILRSTNNVEAGGGDHCIRAFVNG